MDIVNWQDLGFEHNPFSLLPGQIPGKLIWAGLDDTKEKLDSALIEVLTSNASKLFLNVSKWGGGKTHTANYYANSENLPSINNFEYNLPLHCYIITPKEGSKAAYEFYKKIIDEIGIEYISAAVKLMRTSTSDEESLKMIKEWSGSDDLGRVIWLLGENDEEISFTSSELLYNKPSASDRSRLRIRRGIEDTTDRFKILSAIFKVLAEYSDVEYYNPERKVILWIDEIESLIHYTSKQYVPFSQALRELLDMTPKNLIVFMNFSLTDFDDLRTLDYIIGSALSDRINKKIIFNELSIEDSVDYVLKLMQSYRLESFDKEPYSPFTKTSLNSLFELGVERTNLPLTPRLINKWCEGIIKKSVSEAGSLLDNSFLSKVKFNGDQIE